MRLFCVFFFFFKQKTAYEMRISDWSSDVCSSDLDRRAAGDEAQPAASGRGLPRRCAAGLPDPRGPRPEGPGPERPGPEGPGGSAAGCRGSAAAQRDDRAGSEPVTQAGPEDVHLGVVKAVAAVVDPLIAVGRQQIESRRRGMV